MRDYGYVKEYGEGVDRIFQDMTALGLPPPQFSSGNGQVILTLFNAIDERELSIHRESTNTLIQINKLKIINEYEKEILQFAIENDGITPKEAQVVIGRTINTARAVLKELSSEKLPILLRKGRSATDPWKVPQN